MATLFAHRRYRPVLAILAIIALLAAAAPPATAYAYYSEPRFQSISIYPATAEPGTPVSVYVLATDSDGIRDGSVRLESRSGAQWVEVHLHWDYTDDWLVGTLVPNEYHEPGDWQVRLLRINDNEREWTEVSRSELNAGFTLAGSGTPDLAAPVMSGLRVTPAVVQAGQPFTVEATLTDVGSGIAGGLVQTSFASADGETVPTGADMMRVGGNVWRAEFIAPLDPGPSGRLRISYMRVWDVAGNHLDLGETNLNTTVSVVEPSLPDIGGIADDRIDLFYGHPLPFADWAELDLTRIGELYALEYRDKAAAAAALTNEIADLTNALARVEGDLFMPAKPSGLRLASPAVTGRFLALAGALRARLALYSIMTRPSALTYSDVTRWADLAFPLEPSMGPELAAPERYQTYGAALTDLVARGLAESAIPSQLYTGQHLTRSSWNDDLLPDNVVWLTPYAFSDDVVAYHADAEGDIFVGLDDYTLANPLDTIDTAVHELGHHVHSVLLGERGSAGWSDYLALRGVPEDADAGVGHDGQREEAFAVDTVQAYAPAAVLNSTEYSSAFPGPSELPDLADQIRDFVTAELAKGAPDLFLLTNPDREVAVTSSPEFQLQGRARPGETVTIWLGSDLNGLLADYYDGDTWQVTADANGRFSSVLQLDGPGLYTVQAEIDRGGSEYVETAFIVFTDHRPLHVTWAVPADTPLAQVPVTGTAPAGAAIDITGVPTTAGQNGTFAVAVPVAPGPNTLDLTVTTTDGSIRTLSADVNFSPWSALALDALPAAVRTASVNVSGTGNPGEAVVISGGAAHTTTRVGSDRRFSAVVQLKAGLNRLTFHSTGPGTVVASITYDSTSDLTAQLPESTNMPRLIVSGQAEPAATVTVNGAPTPVDAAGRFVAVIRPTATGMVVRVSSTDAAGNTASAVRTVFLKGSAPVQPILKDLNRHWSRSEVESLIALGVVNGLPGRVYEPDRSITRAEYVKMLAVATGLAPDARAYPAVAAGASGLGAERAPFIDTAQHWADGYIQAAVRAGFVVPTDYAEGRFDPDAPISRREIAVMAVRALGLSQRAQRSGGAAQFTDARSIGPLWEGYAVVAQAEGIVMGLPGGVFGPEQPATRAQSATIISRVLAKLER